MTRRGFTLIELMCALLILSLLALMSFRGLGAVLDARDQVGHETEKWKTVAAFFWRFQHDLQLSSPRAASGAAGRFEFSRFAASEALDAPKRIAYSLNARHEVELSQRLDGETAAAAGASVYAVLPGVARFELEYLNG